MMMKRQNKFHYNNNDITSLKIQRDYDVEETLQGNL